MWMPGQALLSWDMSVLMGSNGFNISSTPANDTNMLRRTAQFKPPMNENMLLDSVTHSAACTQFNPSLEELNSGRTDGSSDMFISRQTDREAVLEWNFYFPLYLDMGCFTRTVNVTHRNVSLSTTLSPFCPCIHRMRVQMHMGLDMHVCNHHFRLAVAVAVACLSKGPLIMDVRSPAWAVWLLSSCCHEGQSFYSCPLPESQQREQRAYSVTNGQRGGGNKCVRACKWESMNFKFGGTTPS